MDWLFSRCLSASCMSLVCYSDSSGIACVGRRLPSGSAGNDIVYVSLATHIFYIMMSRLTTESMGGPDRVPRHTTTRSHQRRHVVHVSIERRRADPSAVRLTPSRMYQVRTSKTSMQNVTNTSRWRGEMEENIQVHVGFPRSRYLSRGPRKGLHQDRPRSSKAGSPPSLRNTYLSPTARRTCTSQPSPKR